MPIEKQLQHTMKLRLYDVLASAAQSGSADHPNKDLPQICEVTTTFHDYWYNPGWETNITETQVKSFVSDFDNDKENTFARISVTDADVDRRIQRLRESNPGWVASCIEEAGAGSFFKTIKLDLQVTSIMIAMENRFDGYEPDPTDPHYSLWKEYYRLMANGVENIIDDQCCEELMCGTDDVSVLYNERVYNRYEAKIVDHRKVNRELHGRLLLAEKNMRQQVWASTVAARATRRPTIRARRVSAGHGATAKSGDDGDGGDGEPPRPRSFHTPTPQLYLPNSLATHSLIAGGAQ